MATTGVSMHRRDLRLAAKGEASSRGEGHCRRQGRHGVRSAYAFVSRRPHSRPVRRRLPIRSAMTRGMPDLEGHDGEGPGMTHVGQDGKGYKTKERRAVMAQRSWAVRTRLEPADAGMGLRPIAKSTLPPAACGGCPLGGRGRSLSPLRKTKNGVQPDG